MVNRYAGEIRINPVAVLRGGDFNNDGEIDDIHNVLDNTLEIQAEIAARLIELRNYLQQKGEGFGAEFFFADGGYIGMRGLTDTQLLEMKTKGLIELFDFATDKSWVKKYGAQVGLTWEDGRAVEI
ncbi:MAG: hypothetical protein KF725_15650 [Cyclobacteriaceae bacterium]|nr:hypothetical protein [Cyclobacteriaceae bacterium]UYN87773.1 MAG: hypothetical protein KIT51_05830 [Cyclobacteriaceae bacterium]